MIHQTRGTDMTSAAIKARIARLKERLRTANGEYGETLDRAIKAVRGLLEYQQLAVVNERQRLAANPGYAGVQEMYRAACDPNPDASDSGPMCGPGSPAPAERPPE